MVKEKSFCFYILVDKGTFEVLSFRIIIDKNCRYKKKVEKFMKKSWKNNKFLVRKKDSIYAVRGLYEEILLPNLLYGSQTLTWYEYKKILEGELWE